MASEVVAEMETENWLRQLEPHSAKLAVGRGWERLWLQSEELQPVRDRGWRRSISLFLSLRSTPLEVIYRAIIGSVLDSAGAARGRPSP